MQDAEARRVGARLGDELIAKLALPASCRVPVGHLEDVSPLILLALEDRGVSLVAYYGLNQGLTISQTGAPYLWLQLIRPDDLETSEVRTVPAP